MESIGGGITTRGRVSPLLATISVHVLERDWTERHVFVGILTRSADDGVIVCRTKRAAGQAWQAVMQIMHRLTLTLHPTKTRMVDRGREGVDCLGFHFHKLKSKRTRPLLPSRWPSPNAMTAVLEKVRQMIARQRLSNPLEEVVRVLNMVIRGWRHDFRIGKSTRKLQQRDRYARERLRRGVRSQNGAWGC